MNQIDTAEGRVEVEYDDNGMIKPKNLQPTWKNPPTVSKLKNDVKDAEADFDNHVKNVRGWLDVRDGKLKVNPPKGRSRFQPKLVRKQNEWRYTALTEPLLSSEDMFDVKPLTHMDNQAARDNALILNKQFNKDIDRVEFIDQYIRTAVDEGTVFVRVGWEFEEEVQEIEQPVMVPQLPPELQQQIQQAQQAVQMGQMDPMALQQMQQEAMQYAQMVPDPSGAMEIVEETVTLYNRPTLEVCDYDKVLIDPTCNGDLDKAGFMAYQFQTSRAELNEDPKYSNVKAIIDDSDAAIGGEDYQEKVFNYEDDPRKKLTAIEYWGDWDINDDGTLTPFVATYVGSTMIRLEENPFPDERPPFVKVIYLPKRGDVYGGEPDAVLIEEHQDIVGAITRGMIDLMGKSANAQQGISANALDPAQKLRFEQGKDYIFNPDIDPSKAFFMSTYPDIPRSAMEMIQFHEQGAEALTGIRAFSSQAGGNALGSTATAVKTASDATAKRDMGILRRLSFGVVEIGRKIIAMNAVNLEDEEIIRITDEEEVAISRDELAGHFDIVLSISTPEVDQEQAQDLGFMLQTIGPNMDPGLQAVILGKIARLKKMPDLAKQIEEYQPQPDPAQEKIQELQAQLLEAQVANERAKGTENEADTVAKYADAELTEAKTATERSKSRALESGSDMTDLQFLQEKDGTKQTQSKELEDQRLFNDLERKGVDSLLSKDTPFVGSNEGVKVTDVPPSSGSKLPKFAIGGPDLRGMDTPTENIASSMRPGI